MYSTIRIESDETTARVWLDRPDVRNAFNETLIAEMAAAFEDLGRRMGLRAIVLRGAGKSFCAGADLDWMRRMGGFSTEENERDAGRMARVFTAIDTCPVPVIAAAHGAALGGGCGLVACADIVVASESCQFGLTEVKLGIIPAVIGPFVLAKIGAGQARALFMTGERFDAAHALRIGLVHHVVPEDGIDAAVDRLVAELTTSGPTAAREAKAWIRRIGGLSKEDASALAPRKIAELRASPEGREGIAAFLEKRRPSW